MYHFSNLEYEPTGPPNLDSAHKKQVLHCQAMDIVSIDQVIFISLLNSGLYPLYKFGADFLGKSSARVSVHVRENDVLPDSELTGHADYTNSFASDMGDDPEDASTDQNSPASKIGGVIPSDDDFLKCKQDDASGQVCRVIIEEALHLPVEMTSLGTRYAILHFFYL